MVMVTPAQRQAYDVGMGGAEGDRCMTISPPDFDAVVRWWQQHQESAIAFAYLVRINAADNVDTLPSYQRLRDLCCE